MGNIPTVDRSEIPRPTTWDGEKTLKIMVDFNYQPQLMCSWSPKKHPVTAGRFTVRPWRSQINDQSLPKNQ